jgi:hypothetical protein
MVAGAAVCAMAVAANKLVRSAEMDLIMRSLLGSTKLS